MPFFICLCYALFPGLSPWINDEPILIARAFELNQRAQFTALGLSGTQGFYYGTAPTIIYQALLFIFANNLIWIVSFKAFISSLLLWHGSKKICRHLNFSFYFALLPLSSAYIFLYSRMLWDNCFLIIFGLYITEAAIRLLKTQQTKAIISLTFFSFLALQTHLSIALLLIPIYVFLFLYFLKIKKSSLPLLIGISILLIFIFPYSQIAIQESALNPGSEPLSFLKVLTGGYFLGSLEFLPYFAEELNSGGLKTINLLSGFITFTVSLCALLYLPASIFKKTNKNKSATLLMILTLIFASLTTFLLKLTVHPHYLNAIWPVYFIIMGIYLHGLSNIKFRNLIILTLLIFNFGFIIIFNTWIYFNGGTRGVHYGATLKNQLQVVTELNQYQSDMKIKTNVQNYTYFPHSLEILKKLLPKAEPLKKADHAEISYINDSAEIGLRIVSAK